MFSGFIQTGTSQCSFFVRKLEDESRFDLALELEADLSPFFFLSSTPGASKGLHGVNGLEGWRWTFIIDAVISFAVAILGYIFFPGLPGKDTKPTFWLTASDLELTRQRMKVAGRAEAVPWTRTKVSSFRS